MLLHGLSSNSRIWDFVAPLLTGRFHVVAADQRGHGLSDKPDEGYGFDSVTADLAALIEALSLERPVVVGHSWGAGVALQFAADRPDAAAAIVLVDGGYIDKIGDSWEEAEKQMLPPEIDGTPVSRFLEFMQRWPQIRDIWSPGLGEMVLSNFAVRDDRIYRHLPIPLHMKIARAIFDMRPTQLYARLTVPALIVPCFTDPTSDRERHWDQAKRHGLELIRSEHPNVQLAVMENTIHDIPLQRPHILAEAIQNFAADLTTK